MRIDKRVNGHDLLSDDLYIAAAARAERVRIVKKRQIGVDYAGALGKRLLRFYISGNPFVSRTA